MSDLKDNKIAIEIQTDILRNIECIYKRYKKIVPDIKDINDSNILPQLIPRDKTEELMNKNLLFSPRQKEIIGISTIKREDLDEDYKCKYPIYRDIEHLLTEVNKLETENKHLKLENDDLKQYRDYYKAIFADTFDQSEDCDNIYFNNLKELFITYIISDEKLSNNAISLKYELLAFSMYLVKYLKNDEFYGSLMRHILSEHSDFFTNNLDDYKELDPIIKDVLDIKASRDIVGKLLKDIIEGKV